MKLFNIAKTYGRQVVLVSSGALFSGLVLAQAAADPFDAAILSITGKVGVYGAALVGLSAVGVLFMVAMKYVKRIPRAA